MEKKILLFLFLVISLTTFAQDITITGFLKSKDTGDELTDVNIRELYSQRGAITDANGFFSLEVPPGNVQLVFSFVGYQSDTLMWSATSDHRIEVQLKRSIQLKTVSIQSHQVGRIEEDSQASRHSIAVDQIQKLPALLGETDVLKTLKFLPGVQSGSDASPGLFVRGGSIDQNLILLDGVPIYNPTHVLGLFSSFNADAIESVRMTKGGFPARYGGRLSSVIEVNTKNGDLEDFHGRGQVGLISSRFLIEGPVVPKKSSFLISARRSYTDLIAQPLMEVAQSTSDTKVLPSAFFQDAHLTYSHRLNDKNRLKLSGYIGGDHYGVTQQNDNESTDANITWSNYVGSLNWNHQIANNLFTNAALTYSRYRLDNNIEYSFIKNDVQDFIQSVYFSGINDIGLKYSFDFVPGPRHFLKMGMEWTHHLYSPGALTYRYLLEGDNVSADYNQEKLHSQERNFYLEDDMEFGPLKMNAGFHFSQFFTEGNLYYSFQPRLSVRYLLPGSWALKMSYAQMEQYINLLTSEALSLPTDLWVPSTERIKPQTSWQAVIAMAKTLWRDYEFSWEGYYKEMNHVLSYQPGISFILDVASTEDWQDKITQGRGWAYGTEVLFKKKRGRTTGWLSYTLAWNYRQFDRINQGVKFPFKYDHRHDLGIVLSHELSERWSFSGVWVYGSGNAYSIPDTYFPASPVGSGPSEGYFIYSRKNNYRMSDYHRLDLSITRSTSGRWVDTYWTVGAYNTYSRKNPFFITQDYDGSVREVAVLPFIPYLNWGIKF